MNNGLLSGIYSDFTTLVPGFPLAYGLSSTQPVHVSKSSSKHLELTAIVTPTNVTNVEAGRSGILVMIPL